MRYHLLGRSGLRVSELCLGTMTFGESWGWGASAEESRRIFDAYVDAGGNFVDTANIYTGGESERILGEIITADRRNRVVLATKYTDAATGDDPNAAGNHRKSMVQAVEASLRRLATDRIDLYYVHSWDFTTRPDEVMRGLDDLVRQGKILYAGISDTPAWIVSRCNELADLRGWTPFVANQIEYSLVERTSEREQIPMSRALDLGIVAWAPLAAGLLTGKYTRAGERLEKRRLDTTASTTRDDRNLSIAREADAIADEIGCASAQVALAWVRDKGVIPLVGATSVEQIVANMDYRDVALSPDHVNRLDMVSQVELGFPHDFLRSASRVIYGGMFERIGRHREEGLGRTR
ncbi:MAG TPA: aldo/keto reductase [Sphingomonas sp.]|nr:aldo/keto reductase [Sphingomonas sp.]